MNNIVEKVREAGVVGAGGGGFPTHVKLSNKAGIVIGNGAECEPLLSSDRHLMVNNPEEVVSGLKYACDAVGAKKGIIALKEKYKDAIESLQKAIYKETNLELFLLKDIYPSGDEHLLVYEVTGRIVPQASIPIDVGVVVNNVSTLFNIHNAQDDKPVIMRNVTVCGAVRRSVSLNVPVGTYIIDLLSALSEDQDGKAIIKGGPIMGTLIECPEEVVDKTTQGVVLLPKEHYLVKTKKPDISRLRKLAQMACCQCYICTETCPRYLLGHDLYPHKIMRIAQYPMAYDELNNPLAQTAHLCIECGICGLYACPVGVLPNFLNAKLKEKVSRPDSLLKKIDKVNETRKQRLIPSQRIIDHMDLQRYNVSAEWNNEVFKPDRVKINLKQHTGIDAKPTVKVKEKVKRGQIIGIIPEGKLGASVHCSIDGIVKKITDKSIYIEAI